MLKFLLIIITLSTGFFLFSQISEESLVSDSKLSYEGKNELYKIINDYKKFDRENLEKDLEVRFPNEVNKLFTKEKLDAVTKEAESLYKYCKVGDTVTIETQYKTFRGEYIGKKTINNLNLTGKSLDVIFVGDDSIPISALNPKQIEMLFETPQKMLVKQREYINSNFNNEKSSYLEMITAKQTQAMDECKRKYDAEKKEYIEPIIKKMQITYPILNEATIESLIRIKKDKDKNVLKTLVKEEYSKAQPLTTTQAEVLKIILAKICLENKEYVLCDEQITKQAIVDAENSLLAKIEEMIPKLNADLKSKYLKDEDSFSTNSDFFNKSLESISKLITQIKELESSEILSKRTSSKILYYLKYLHSIKELISLNINKQKDLDNFNKLFSEITEELNTFTPASDDEKAILLKLTDHLHKHKIKADAFNKLLSEAKAEEETNLSSSINKYKKAYEIIPDKKISDRLIILNEKIKADAFNKLVREAKAEEETNLSSSINKYKKAYEIIPDKKISDRLIILNEKTTGL